MSDVYLKHLQSAFWKALCRGVFASQDLRCADCGQRRRLEGHHLTYDRLGNELPHDIIGLCGDCHASRHGLIHQAPLPFEAPVIETLKKAA